jgi:ABC-2 type transport system permease protein
MSDLALAVRQVGYTNKAFWRNPASAFFTFAFPLMFVVIFTSLLGSGDTTLNGVTINLSTYYVVAEAAFGVISATYTNVAISTTFNRDGGILKRTRGTPLPAWAYMSGKVIHAMILAFILVAITVAFGAVFYSVSIPTGLPLLQFLVMLAVGGLSFCALALAITSIIPNADAAPPVVNASILPLLFLSGIFVPLGDNTPQWIITIGTIFPVKHFADAMRAGFLPHVMVTTPAGQVQAFPFEWTDVLVVAVWGVAGLVLAARFFTWEPRT